MGDDDPSPSPHDDPSFNYKFTLNEVIAGRYTVKVLDDNRRALDPFHSNLLILLSICAVFPSLSTPSLGLHVGRGHRSRYSVAVDLMAILPVYDLDRFFSCL
jgi:hypothetical protein